MKKLFMTLLILSLTLISFIGCTKSDDLAKTYNFKGIIASKDTINVIVTPNEGEYIRKSGDSVAIYFINEVNAKKFNVRDEVTLLSIYFNNKK